MNRPYVICHMLTSIDGKVTGDFLTREQTLPGTELYYEIHRNLESDAYACGSVTMEQSFTGGFRPELVSFLGAKLPRDDFIAQTDAPCYAVAFDRRGRLGWQQSRIRDDDPGYDNAHVVEVLCERADDTYLAYLQSIGVSYIFAGKKEMDLPLALAKLQRYFGIRRLLLEGGSILNGAFLQAGVIDEISLVVTPSVAATGDKSLFDQGRITDFTLEEVRAFDGGLLHLNYKMGGSERE